MNAPGISPKGSDRLSSPKGLEKNDQGSPEKLTVFEQALLLDPSHFADIYMQFLLSGVSLDQQGQGVFISKVPAAGEEHSTDNHLETEKVDLSAALPPTAAGELAASSSDVASATVSSAITLTDFANTKGALDTGINTEAEFEPSLNATPPSNSFEPALAQTIQTQTVPLSALSDLIPTPTAPVPSVVQTNTAAILGGASVGLAETNAPLSTSGVLSISDVDSPATFAIQANVAGSNGVFNIAADGAWTYVANSAFDSLNVGQSLSDTFNVQSSDGTTTSVIVTINGSNDAAILSSAIVPLTETNAALSTSGTLTVSDVDNPATFVAQTGIAGNHGVFSIAADGAWTFVANSAFNSLNVGESVSDTFTVQSSDGTATSVTVTINGSNDAAILSSATVPLTETNAALSTSGTLTVSDVDNPATFVAQTGIAGNHGVFSIAADGAWTFVANSAFNSLNVGESVSDTFTVQSSDGAATSVTVTINGSNDAAILSSATVPLTETNAALSTSGTLTVSDVDNPATFVAQTGIAGNHGVFSIAADGAWTFVANSAFNNLNVGESVSDTFTVQSSDGTATSVTVTINGSNDAAILSSATVPLTETNAPLSTSGTLTISDVDDVGGFVAQSNVVGTAGVFNIASNGAWTFVANSAFNNLNLGQSVSDTFTVQSNDGTTTSVTVTINGSNDAAILSSATVPLTETNAPLSTSGTLTISDVDNPATFVAQTGTVGNYGVFSIAADGVWTYVANSDFNSLNVGQSLSDPFIVQSSDGTTTSVTVTINGSNDAAILSSAVIALTETDAALSTSGTLTITDVDNPATFVAQSNVAGSNGIFNIASNGAWTFVANSAFNNLNVGQSVTNTFNVQSSDGTASAVTITINGTNDAPVAQVDFAGTVLEGKTLTNPVNVLSNDTDVDNTSLSVAQLAQNAGGTGAIAVNGINTITTALGGTILMNANGTYTYTAPASLDHSSNDTLVDSFFYKTSDGSSQSAWTQVSINVNDTAPIAVSDVDNVGFGGLVYGNVITGGGGNGSGADTLGADSTRVSSVTYHGTTYSNFADVLLSAGGASTLASWTNNGVQVLGYNLDTGVFGAAVTPGVRSNYGLFIDSPGGSDDSNEIDSNSTTQTEAIALNLGANYRSMQVTFRDVQSDDQIGWKAYDSNQVLVDSGMINNTANGTGSRAEASFTITSSAAFQYIAFFGTDSTDDFTLWSISNATPAVSNPSLTINADHGTFVFYQNGGYTYQSTETLTSAGGGNNLSTWTSGGIQVLGYNMGTAIFGTSVIPSVRSGFGLYINSPGTDDSNELDSTSTTQTETIALNMGSDYRSLQVTFRDVQADDQIAWKAYNSSQVLVDSGVINNTAIGSGSANEASFTITPNGAFRYIAFSGTDANDNFTLWSISNGVKVLSSDVFSYTLTDADNDTSSANLSIAHQGTVTGVADVNNVYESGLSTGTDPGHADIVVSGNLFSNDDGLSGTSSITQVTFDSTTATPINGVLSIDTPQGLLTVYTATADGHIQGDYQYTLQAAGDPLNEVFTYRITDSATGHTSDSTLTVNIVDDVHVLTGTSSAETLTGGNYSDFIDAKGGNDTLFAGLGPDTLIGGQGSDTMTGGGGQDTFTWKSGDNLGSPTDTITDFAKGVGGDVLDLSQLLTGESHTAQSLDSYLNFNYNSASNATVVSVNPDGGATFNVTQTIVLAGVDLTAGGTLHTDQDILTTLINNGNLKTD